ncbi:MAG TPA: hypothetical protein VMY36_03065 [Patescibacteria group bacterium]|nr:hypothetical protein [Patescibacteria group bacterium]
MTMVLAYKFKEGTVMISDSRATWVDKRINANILEDKLQKILPLGNRMVIGYAGDVKTAALVINSLRGTLKKKSKLNIPNVMVSELCRIAKFYYKKIKEPLAFILGTINNSGKIEVSSFEFPSFAPQKVNEGFTVIGSGNIVAGYLRKNANLFEKPNQSLKQKADLLYINLGSELGRQGIDTVGGLFQTILIESDGIRPLWYGFVDIDPDKEPNSKSIEMEKGVWTQHDLTKNITTQLVEPIKLITEPAKRLQFHDFEMPPGESAVKWHLTYFLTCTGIKISPGTIEFFNPLTNIASHKFPFSVELIAAVGLWGSAGDHKLRFVLKNFEEKEVYSQDVHIEYLPEEIDTVSKIYLSVEKPGPAILECYIDKQLIGRRAMYFGHVKEDVPSPDKKDVFMKKQQEIMMDHLRKCVDEVIEKSGKAELVYFTICEKSIYEESYLKFENQFMVSYWKNYPLPLRAHIASAFRLPIGTHHLEIRLVNASTRESFLVDTATVVSSSSFVISPVDGDMIFKIPKPGIYFVSIYIDDTRIGTAILAAESDNPKFSFTLMPEQVAQIQKGELLNLLKRAPQHTSN